MNHWETQLTELGRYDRIFFSPHLDDVGFSCPGAILAATERGERVLVVIVFSEAAVPGGAKGAGLPGVDDPEALYELRRREERQAASLAGYDVMMAGLADAPFRRPFAQSSVFMELTWSGVGAEDDVCDEIVSLMHQVIRKTDPQEVMVPLGVGRHIDHRLVFEAFRRLTGRVHRWETAKGGADLPGDLSFWCYEDRPYALVDQATKMRLKELGFPVRLDAPRFFAALWSAHYVQQLFEDSRERPICGANYMESIQSPQRASRPPTSRLFASDAISTVWQVVSSYQSQLADFVGDRRQFEWVCKLEARRRRSQARYVERQWNPLRLRSTASTSYF